MLNIAIRAILMLCISGQVLTNDHEYFEYSSDCVDECIEKRESCSISEPDPGNFVRQCYTENNACALKASPFEVCLRFNEPPLGGRMIWLEYKDLFYPSSQPHLINYAYILYSVLSFVFGATLGFFARPICVRWIERNQTADFQRLVVPGAVYQPTVEPIESTSTEQGV